MKYLASIIGWIVIIVVLACLLFPILGWLVEVLLGIACIVGIVTIVKKLKK